MNSEQCPFFFCLMFTIHDFVILIYIYIKPNGNIKLEVIHNNVKLIICYYIGVIIVSILQYLTWLYWVVLFVSPYFFFSKLPIYYSSIGMLYYNRSKIYPTLNWKLKYNSDCIIYVRSEVLYYIYLYVVSY